MAYFTSRVYSSLKRVPNFRLGHYRSSHAEKNGLVLGVYSNKSQNEPEFTPAARKVNDKTNGKLLELLQIAGPHISKGKSRIFYNLCSDFPVLALVGLGNQEAGFNEEEQIHEGKEAIRVAAGVGCQQLQNIGVSCIAVEDMGDSKAAAEGAALGVWKYQEFKNKEKQTKLPTLQLFCGNEKDWHKGLTFADAQNFARRLMDTPANHMTPSIFAQNAVGTLNPLGVKVEVRDKVWAEQMSMGSFLSVAKGSVEPPLFLEISYNGGEQNDKPVVLVGKGITFDSGGISIKSSASMDEMRADMGGAACVVATIKGAASLKLPVNIVGLIPLCENMPSGGANKPGDVVIAMNGKSIQIDNTDAEGRLILADALCYSKKFKGQIVVDIATLTGAIRIALGPVCSGVFTNSTLRWNQLSKASADAGDRVWRMPLWNFYRKQVTDYPSVDVNNVSKLKMAGSCTAAAFLHEFVPKGDWIHMDIAGVMGPTALDTTPYLVKGMTGRPTRSLITFLSQLC